MTLMDYHEIVRRIQEKELEALKEHKEALGSNSLVAIGFALGRADGLLTAVLCLQDYMKDNIQPTTPPNDHPPIT